MAQRPPRSTIQNVETPVLFIHGDADAYVPTHMSVDMHLQKPGFKRLHISPGADHAKAFSTNKKLYYEAVNDFLNDLP